MFDQILSVCGICAETICLTCFVMTGAMRALPSMFWFLIYTVISEIVGYVFYTAGNMRSYWLCYVVIAVVGYLVELAVGWELAVRSAGVVAPESQHKVRRIAMWSFCTFAILAATMASLVSYRGLDVGVNVFLHCELGFAIFRALMFIAILASTYIWGISWNDRGAQVLAGLSVYSVFALFAEVAHEIAALMPYQYGAYVLIERLRCCAWCASMLLLSWQVVACRDYRGFRIISGSGAQAYQLHT